MPQTVCVRFAPSPTGPLHIGGVRTALYNYLLAKKYLGRFILRLEDTDQSRLVPGAEQYIADVFRWLGIEADEGPTQGGPQGPYRQSAREKIYRTYADRLVKAGKAYYAFDTPQELAAMRDQLQTTQAASPQYNAISREWMKNSLTLPPKEVAARLRAGVPYTIRIKVPYQTVIRFYDQIRGWIKVQAATIDDKILMKSDGTPTYHLANVVDDYLMQITHVIRGEEWLPSTPIHVLLYQYLGLEQNMPQFVHLPLLMKSEGPGKLSKRHADQHGFPVFPISWQDPDTGVSIPGLREYGYLPEAVLNFLALLGWSPAEGEREFFTLEELVQAFSLERIHKAGIKFDAQKAAWFNQQHLRAKPEVERVRYLTVALDEHHIAYTTQHARQVCQLVQERAVFPRDFWEQGKYFFQAPDTYTISVLKGKWNGQIREVLQAVIAVLQSVKTFQAHEIKASLTKLLEARQIKHSQVMPVVRVALTGTGVGPDLIQIMEVMGRAETIRRIMRGLEQFDKMEDLAI